MTNKPNSTTLISLCVALVTGCNTSSDGIGQSRQPIVGGATVTDITPYPYTAVMKNNDTTQWWDETSDVPSGFWCTATMIAPSYAVVGAHCVTTTDANGNLTVVRPETD